MSVLVAGAAGLAAYEALRARIPVRVAALAGTGLAGLLWQPVPALVAAVGGAAVLARRRLATRRRAAERAEADVPLLAELTLLGLTAGLPFGAALAAAAEEVDEALGAGVRAVLRRSRRTGLGAALHTGEGPAHELFRLAARATATGAPLAVAVAGFVDQARHTERSARMAAARKLPVRLLLPLALLILPGFVVLTMGPALLSALDRLQL